MTFGQRFKAFRNKRHISQRVLAERSGSDTGEISRIEHGKYIPKPNTMARFAKGFRVPLDDLRASTRYPNSSSYPNSNSSNGINLDKAFDNHEYFTYHNKKLDSDTINYIKSALKFRFGSKSE